MKFRFLTCLLAPALLLTGCLPFHEIPSKVTARKVDAGITVKDYAVYYSLPRTVIDLEVVVDKKITRPGPFAAYAERFLGLPGVPTRETTVYSISEIRVSSHAERDPGQMYRMETEGKNSGSCISLTADGLIRGINLPVNPEVAVSQEAAQKLFEKQFDYPKYPDLTMRKHTEPLPDTIYRVVRTDTSFIRIPLLRKLEGQKSLLNQAEEAAEVLMKLREGRFKLLNGEYAYVENDGTRLPENESLEVVIRELAAMEEAYVSLFAGRTQTEREVVKFTYTPLGHSPTESAILFSFSPQGGIEAPESGTAERVVIELSRNDISAMDEVQWADEDPKAPRLQGLAYRMPEKSRVEIKKSGETLFAREFLVAQCGRVDFVPESLLKDGNISIEFYPAYGSIKNIFRR